jgi:hypothetical protein
MFNDDFCALTRQKIWHKDLQIAGNCDSSAAVVKCSREHLYAFAVHQCFA